MAEASTLGPQVEKGVVSWLNGVLLHGNAPERVKWDVRLAVERGLTPPYGRRAVLTTMLHPVSQAIISLDGCGVEVQTFRYKGFDGVERQLCFCASCGDLATADADDLAAWAVVGCRKCGMALSTVGDLGPCPEWHTFGSCLRCPVSAVEMSAFAGGRGAGAEDRPAPHAGPATTEQGPGLPAEGVMA